MNTNYTSCQLGLECVGNQTPWGAKRGCYNFFTCDLYTQPWSLPFNYEIIEGIPTLTVVPYMSVSPIFGWQVLEELRPRVNQAWLDEGWQAAWELPPEDHHPEIPF